MFKETIVIFLVIIVLMERTNNNYSVLISNSLCARYLGVTGNQYGRPISGQSEVVGLVRQGMQTKWQAMEGVFVGQSELPTPSPGSDQHVEL